MRWKRVRNVIGATGDMVDVEEFAKQARRVARGYFAMVAEQSGMAVNPSLFEIAGKGTARHAIHELRTIRMEPRGNFEKSAVDGHENGRTHEEGRLKESAPAEQEESAADGNDPDVGVRDGSGLSMF